MTIFVVCDVVVVATLMLLSLVSCIRARVSITTLELDTVVEASYFYQGSLYQYKLVDSPINLITNSNGNGLYFFTFPCRGGFDMFLSENVAPSDERFSDRLTWEEFYNLTFKLMTATDTTPKTFYMMLLGPSGGPSINELARIVVSKDKRWPAKNVVHVSDPKLTGQVVGGDLLITFNPVAPRAGFKDSYEVFTQIGEIRRTIPGGTDFVGDPVLDPLNGCSMPSFLKRLDKQPTINNDQDPTLRTFSVSTALDQQIFTVGLRVCRRGPAVTDYVWCTAYELFSVCNGTTQCPSPRGVAVAPADTADDSNDNPVNTNGAAGARVIAPMMVMVMVMFMFLSFSFSCFSNSYSLHE